MNQGNFEMKSSQRGSTLISLAAALGVGSVLAIILTNTMSQTSLHSLKVGQTADLNSVRGLILQKMSCENTLDRPPARACNSGQYIDIFDNKGEVLVSSAGTSMGDWMFLARCTNAGIDLRVSMPRDGAGGVADFGASPTLFKNDPSKNRTLTYSWSHPRSQLFPVDPVTGSRGPAACSGFFNFTGPNSNVNNPTVCDGDPRYYIVGVNFATNQLVCRDFVDPKGFSLSNLRSESIPRSRARREYEARGSNDSECASLSRMVCPAGYYMYAYEALQATAGGHCSVRCKSFY